MKKGKGYTKKRFKVMIKLFFRKIKRERIIFSILLMWCFLFLLLHIARD